MRHLFAAIVAAVLSIVPHHHHRPPMKRAVASWYDDSPSLACRRSPRGLGVASLAVPCGTHVRLCHRGCVTALVDDHGPYVVGRTFDLNARVKAAISCSDLCRLRWRIISRH